MNAPRLVALLIVAALPAASGCGSYILRGKVVRGSMSTMSLVDPVDSRLSELGVRHVQVVIYRDPDRLAIHSAGRALSDANGWFDLEVNEFGAGWMDEEWLVRASRQGFATAELKLRLPPKHDPRPLLIVVAPGVSETPAKPEDLMEQYERFR
ncbi:MAG: hypothetical protein ACYSTY_11070 [Planctomycetota bacterium]|jgi:hypothetical protein